MGGTPRLGAARETPPTAEMTERFVPILCTDMMLDKTSPVLSLPVST